MYCRGKRYSPSSSQASIINRVFHVSWFPNKSKQKSSHPQRTKSSKIQPDRPTPNTPLPAFQNESRFYSLDDDDDDDDAYWRLSFREQKTEDRKSITGIAHLSSDDDEFQIPVSGITSSGHKEPCITRNRDDDDADDACRRKKENGDEKLTTTPTKKKDRRSRIPRWTTTGPDDDSDLIMSRSWNPVVQEIFPVEMEEGFDRDYSPVHHNSEKHQNVSLRNSSLDSSPEEDYAFGRRVRYDGTEFRRKSHCRKIKQRKSGNNYSPKREFRVRVLEDMKKEKMMRLEKKETVTARPIGSSTTIYDSFAEVKDSFNPQQDFRDSMVEIICEIGIRRPEELEDLLTCYLNLNCDEHHHLIIKVFQQVLLELSQQRCGELILKRKS
ncbi:hypothetical protein OROGR_003049 [Orobanche gracilis]